MGKGIQLCQTNEAIGMKTPDELYTKSERKYTGDYDELEYPIGFLV